MSNEPSSPKVPANANPTAPAPAATNDAKPVTNASGPAATSATAPSNAAAPVAAAAAVAPANPSAPATPGAPPAPSTQEGAQPAAPAWTPPKPLPHDQALALLVAKFPGAKRDPRDKWDLTVIVAADQLRSVCLFLRHELAVDMLLDVVGVDYLSYPNHREARFAVIYALKSLTTNQRVKIKLWVEEEHPHVPSLADLYKIANWMEREVWDQVGIVFDGHPNPKRLLNHHEFVGHPLRKDYPCQKRQKLSVNDPMVDQLTLRLRENGYTVLDDGGVDANERFANRPGDIDGVGGPRMNDPDLQSTANGLRAEDKRGVL